MTKKNYINNKDFEVLIRKYKKEPEKYEEELMKTFDLLISNIIEGFKFKLDKEDAKQDCFYLILKTLKNFKPKKGTAFTYFTTIIVNNLKLLYSKNKRYNIKIQGYLDQNKDKIT
jgi:DNA-directed RNA polymerase specialized sigma subunit